MTAPRLTPMKSAIWTVISFVGILFVGSGCTSFFLHTHSEQFRGSMTRVYPGTCANAELIVNPNIINRDWHTPPPIIVTYGILDFIPSAALDTLLLPVDLATHKTSSAAGNHEAKSSPQKPDTASWPSAARNPSTLEHGKYWTPTIVERARGEQLARWYACRQLALSSGQVSKMKTDCIGWHKNERTELYVRFFDPKAFGANTDFSAIAVDGGFPGYFSVTVDVGSWRVVDHYAERE